MKRIVFFDGPCPFCNWIVRGLMDADKKKIFWFASLQGKTAQDVPKQGDSMILLEEDKSQRRISYESKAALRVFWLLGGKYSLIGWMYILPGAIINPLYRWVARNRYRLFSSKFSPLDERRLLP